MNEREMWEACLANIEADGVSAAQAAQARSLWSRVTAMHGEVLPPAASTLDGVLYLSWDRRSAHHFDVEIDQSGACEWFYKNRDTGALDGTDGEREAFLPDAAIAYLSAFKVPVS